MKKLLVKIVVVSFLVAGFSTSSFAANCTGITMKDTKGVAGGNIHNNTNFQNMKRQQAAK